MSTITIRRAENNDLPALVAFNQIIAKETEGKHLADHVISPGVENLLKQPQYGFYLVAVSGTETIGSLMVTYEWSDWRNGLIWWIQSVYVDTKWRRQGVYRRLYQQVKTLAQEHGAVRGFRLYVERNNHTAQQTYHALGMEESDYLLFEEMTTDNC